jgi:hypothetical protein
MNNHLDDAASLPTCPHVALIFALFTQRLNGLKIFRYEYYIKSKRWEEAVLVIWRKLFRAINNQDSLQTNSAYRKHM